MLLGLPSRPGAGIIAYWSWFAFNRSQNDFALEMFSEDYSQKARVDPATHCNPGQHV
jgi:hypothetical protein